MADFTLDEMVAAIWGHPTRTLTTTKPDNPAAPELCRVHAYVETSAGYPAMDVTFIFELIVSAPSKTTRLLTRDTLIAVTNIDGQLIDEDGRPYQELQRNDHITPAGSYWQVTCHEIGFRQFQFFVTTSTLDLMTLIPFTAA